MHAYITYIHTKKKKSRFLHIREDEPFGLEEYSLRYIGSCGERFVEGIEEDRDQYDKGIRGSVEILRRGYVFAFDVSTDTLTSYPTVFVRKLTNSALEEVRKRSSSKKKTKMMNPEDVLEALANIDMSVLKEDLKTKLDEIKKAEAQEKERKRKRKLAQPSEEELKEQQRKLFATAAKVMMQKSLSNNSTTS